MKGRTLLRLIGQGTPNDQLFAIAVERHRLMKLGALFQQPLLLHWILELLGNCQRFLQRFLRFVKGFLGAIEVAQVAQGVHGLIERAAIIPDAQCALIGVLGFGQLLAHRIEGAQPIPRTPRHGWIGEGFGQAQG